MRDGRGYGPYGTGYYQAGARTLPYGPNMERLTADFDFQPGPDGSFLSARPPIRTVATKPVGLALQPIFGVVQPATLFHRMDEVDAAMKATNAAITLNLAAPTDYTRNWADFFARWVTFNANERSFFHVLNPAAWLLRSDDTQRETEAKASQLEEIRAQYPSQPSKTGGAPAPLGGPSVPKLPSGGDGAFPVATVAVVVGIVAIAAVAVLYAPEIKLALGARR